MHKCTRFYILGEVLGKACGQEMAAPKAKAASNMSYRYGVPGLPDGYWGGRFSPGGRVLASWGAPSYPVGECWKIPFYRVKERCCGALSYLVGGTTALKRH